MICSSKSILFVDGGRSVMVFVTGFYEGNKWEDNIPLRDGLGYLGCLTKHLVMVMHYSFRFLHINFTYQAPSKVISFSSYYS